MHFRQTAILFCISLVTGINSGCCWRDAPVCKTCVPFVSKQTPLEVSLKPEGAAVTTDFASLPDYQSARQSLLAQVATEDTVAITMKEVICLAAQNSELAEVIEQERHLLKCRLNQQTDSEPGSSSCSCQRSSGHGIDIVLQGEALEQRNLAAGKAAQAFLGLAQISLQLELIDESRKRLSELEKTVAAANDAGFATAEGMNHIQKARLQIDRKESQLEAAHQELTYQLNLLINVGEQPIVVFQPVHDINPQRTEVNVLSETALAESNRPGILAAESVISHRCDGEGLYRLLSMFDARIGQQLQAKPIKKVLLRRQLIEFLKAAEAPDSTLRNRKSQAEKIVNLRKREARLSTAKAMLEMQTAFEKLTIAHADIQRIEKRAEVIEAGKEVDARDSYLRENENWVELQQARSERIEAAIEFEIAQVKLQQAQGLLGQSCGHTLHMSGCN